MDPKDPEKPDLPDEAAAPRRKMLWVGVLASLAAAYATLTSYALGFIFPQRRGGRAQRIFIGFTKEIDTGESKSLTLPSGDQMIVSNTGRINVDTGSTFIGFSSRCPHLGCRVQWESKEQHFLCPCHQGIFTADGVAISGPPAQANQKLRPYPIELDGDSMYAVVEDV